MTENMLISLGCKVWEGGEHRRIYINTDEQFEAVFGLKVERYNGGGIKRVELDGDKLSNNKAFKILTEKHFFDCVAKKWHSSLTPII